MRALVSTKEAGVIIGKAGKNVAELREVTGVKAGVSKVIQGIHDRVLSVVGTLDGVAKVNVPRERCYKEAVLKEKESCPKFIWTRNDEYRIIGM